MYKRFVLSFAVAALLGLATTEATPAEQLTFETENAALDAYDHPITASNALCNMFDDWTYFRLGDLTGPYLGEITAETATSYFQVQFCGVSSYNSTNKDYAAESAFTLTVGGDVVPEAPLGILIPVVGAVMVAGAFMVLRRRSSLAS